MISSFKDRKTAGQLLAQKLQKYASVSDLLILGLPRGGVVVAYEVAMALRAPLDVFLVRKLGVPYQPELAMGAIAEGGVLLVNEEVVNYLSISKDTIDEVVNVELEELHRREKMYRNNGSSPQIAGHQIIVVDDGLATGATMKAAVKAIKSRNPKKIIVAIPVGAPQTCREIQQEVDELVCLMSPEPFSAVGNWFDNFDQTTDQEVRELLEKAHDYLKK